MLRGFSVFSLLFLCFLSVVSPDMTHSPRHLMSMYMCCLPFMGAGRAEARSEAPPER